jgi:hypothetical protein
MPLRRRKTNQRRKGRRSELMVSYGKHLVFSPRCKLSLPATEASKTFSNTSKKDENEYQK